MLTIMCGFLRPKTWILVFVSFFINASWIINMTQNNTTVGSLSRAGDSTKLSSWLRLLTYSFATAERPVLISKLLRIALKNEMTGSTWTHILSNTGPALCLAQNTYDSTRGLSEYVTLAYSSIQTYSEGFSRYFQKWVIVSVFLVWISQYSDDVSVGEKYYMKKLVGHCKSLAYVIRYFR